MNNEEEIVELTDALEGALSDFATTEIEFSVPKPAIVLTSIPEESSKNNAEETDEVITEVTDVPEGAQSDFSTTEMKDADSTPVEVHIQISEESSKNNAEETAEVTDSVVVTDAPEGAQHAITNNLGATKVKATKVAKAKSADKKGTSLTSQNSIAKNRPRRTCTLKSTSLRQPMVEASRKVLTDSLVSQKRMSDFFPKK